MRAGLSDGEALREPHAATDEEILRAHDAGYLRRVVSGELTRAEARQIGFLQMVERSRRSAGATIEACRAALDEGIGINLAGGTHHAFRFSIRSARNFPFRKEASDLDVELADGTGDAEYLDALERGICHALSAAQPELAIYLAGADPYRSDRLGRLALSKEGLRAIRWFWIFAARPACRSRS